MTTLAEIKRLAEETVAKYEKSATVRIDFVHAKNCLKLIALVEVAEQVCATTRYQDDWEKWLKAREDAGLK